METHESCTIEPDANSGILSASELVRIKKSNDEPTRYNIGEKFYNQQNSWLESKAVECALENFSETLKQYRAARKCDLIQAEWNAELNVSVTAKLKGKFLQHMGCAHDGKILLSPEESIFLLENGCIEILNGKMPLSTEEAYKIMLKGNLSTEKYQVYSQLSQLGFLVVPHRKELGVKDDSTDNRQAKQKRKASTEMYKAPEKKRTSFLGALSNLPNTSVCSAEKEDSVPEIAGVSAESISEDCLPIAPLPSSSYECNTIETSDVSSEVKETNKKILNQSSTEVFAGMEEGEQLPSVSKDLPDSPSSNLNNDPSVLINSPSIKEVIQEDCRLSFEDSKINNVLKSKDNISENKISMEIKDTITESCCDTNENPVLSELETRICESTADREKSNIPHERNETASENEISLQVEDTISESSNDVSLNPSPANIKVPVPVSVEDNKKINTEVEPENKISLQVEDTISELSNDVSLNHSPANIKVPVSVEDNKKINTEVEPENEISLQVEDIISESSNDVSLNSSPANIKVPVHVSVEDNKKINSEVEPEKNMSEEENYVEIEDSNSELSDDNSNPDSSNFESPVRVSNKAIDIMNIDSQNTETSEPSGVLRNNVSSSNINENLEDSSCSDMDAVSLYAESNSDVMSCSSNEVLSVCDESSEQPERLEDDEVELVAVTKKETKPLAVIDLLSEEEDSESDNSASDDDIQVVKVCENVHSKTKQTPRSSVIHATVNCKKEEKNISRNLGERAPCISFPDCVKKNMVVVTRPPSTYLPPNVALSKESYVLTFAPCQVQAQRVWNSFRDLEDFRRQNQRAEGFPPRNARASFNRNRMDSSDNHELSSLNQNNLLEQGRPSMNPWLNPVGNSNQRSSPQGFSNFQNSDQRPWMHENVNGSQNPNFFNRRPFLLNEPVQNQNFPSMNMSPDMRVHLPTSTAINSVVSVSNQDMNVSMVGNHILHPPQMDPSSLLPGFNANLGGLRPMDLMAAVQRTAYSVATDVLSSMLGSNVNPHMMPQIPPFNSTFPPVPNGSYRMPPPINSPFSSSFNGEQGLVNRRRDQYRRHRLTNPFPCEYRNVSNKGSWSEIRQAFGETDMELDVGSDVEEVPISSTEVLWDSKGICPLVKPSTKYPPSEVLKKLQITQMANLLSNSHNNQMSVSTTCCLEISFDVYLPGTNYRKTCPGIPKHRIMVFRSTDPLPKYADIVFLQKKWNDGATLQLAVVDNGDVSFHSFNSIYLPVLTPHKN